jgi:nucleoside-diphosphate-sugar epimerase
MADHGTVFLTGPRSFTAGHLVPHLEAAGYRLAPFRGDITDPEALRSAVAEAAPRYVVHLAALSFPPTATGAEVYAVNTVGTDNLLRACSDLAHPPERLLLPSTAHVYGPPAPERPVPFGEGLCPAPRGHYAISKLAMEHAAAGYAGRLAICLPRPFNYTGPGQDTRFLVPKLVAAYRRRDPELRLGNLAVARDFSDVRWVAAAYAALLATPGAEGPVNVCSGQPRPLRAILDHLAARTGHRPRVERDPALVRPDEPESVYGDPARLHRLVPDLGPAPSLEAILDAMLDAANGSGGPDSRDGGG